MNYLLSNNLKDLNPYSQHFPLAGRSHPSHVGDRMLLRRTWAAALTTELHHLTTKTVNS